MKCNAQITFKCDNEFKERIERIATEERRTVSSMIKIILEDWITEHEKEKGNDN